jgi:capsular exopolysaccharide synthesis family protein
VYVKTAPRTYQAQAQMLISPVSTANTTLVGLPVLHSSSDPTSDVLTAAALITGPQVARGVVTDLHLHESPGVVLGSVTATPVAQSNLVAVQVTADSAQKAQAIANSFVRQVVKTREAALHAAIAIVIPGLKAQVAALPASTRNGPGTLGDQLSQLELLQSSADPTITIASPADLPSGPSSPKTKLTLVAALFAGLMIGIGAAFGWDALDPRLRREQQLRELLRLPILARIPRERPSRKGQPMLPDELSFFAAEGYRTLRAMLTSRTGARQSAFLVTGSAPSEGKTTSAINLAAAIAQAGSRVILIEADLRRPTIAATLGLSIRHGTEDVLIGDADLKDALTVARFQGVPVSVLAVRRPGIARADRLSFATAQQLVKRAKSLCDFVVIDSPPLTAVMDALPLAKIADEVIIVARLGNPKLSQIAELHQLLLQQGKPPLGVLLIGAPAGSGSSYYTAHDNDRPPSARRRELVEHDIETIAPPSS